MIDIAGYCPMGCGHTLYVGEDGFITCDSLGCPRPDAVATLLQERETQHIIHLERDAYTIRHPLHERLDDAFLDCRVHEHMSGHERAPFEPGQYRVRKDRTGAGWIWDRVREQKGGGDA